MQNATGPYSNLVSNIHFNNPFVLRYVDASSGDGYRYGWVWGWIWGWTLKKELFVVAFCGLFSVIS